MMDTGLGNGRVHENGSDADQKKQTQEGVPPCGACEYHGDRTAWFSAFVDGCLDGTEGAEEHDPAYL